jgi:hypothetical protein
MEIRKELTDNQFWQQVNDRLRSIPGTLEAAFDITSGDLRVNGETAECREPKEKKLEAWHHVAQLIEHYDFPSRALVLQALQKADAQNTVRWTTHWLQVAQKPAPPGMVLFTREPGGPHNQRGYTEEQLASRIRALESEGLSVPRYYELAMNQFRNNKEFGTDGGPEPFESW